VGIKRVNRGEYAVGAAPKSVQGASGGQHRDNTPQGYSYMDRMLMEYQMCLCLSANDKRVRDGERECVCVCV
jgi:hypothetical protein